MTTIFFLNKYMKNHPNYIHKKRPPIFGAAFLNSFFQIIVMYKYNQDTETGN